MEKSGVTPPELENAPELPDECAGLWQVFIDLGHNVSASDIHAYVELTGHDLSPWEVEAILALHQLRSVNWQQNTPA